MKYQYKESFDSSMKTYRRIYNLDTIGMFFLSEFSNSRRTIVKYSVDVEKANDSHYEIDAADIGKLTEALHCKNQTNELVSAIAKLISNFGENGFAKFLNDKESNIRNFILMIIHMINYLDFKKITLIRIAKNVEKAKNLIRTI